MKSMITALALVMAAAPAMAYDDAITFLSWCEGNKVVAQRDGKPYVRFNCEDQGLVCKVYQAPFQTTEPVYTAACDKK